MRVTEEEYERLKDRPTDKVANVESVIGNEPLAKGKSKKHHKKYNIHVHHRTNRTADPDGRSIKAVLDAIVNKGILPDDSAKFINQITQSQEVVKGGEETIIEIREV